MRDMTDAAVRKVFEMPAKVILPSELHALARILRQTIQSQGLTPSEHDLDLLARLEALATSGGAGPLNDFRADLLLGSALGSFAGRAAPVAMEYLLRKRRFSPLKTPKNKK